MLAVLPVLAIPFLMGSVTHAEFGRIALVAVNLLFFLLSIGILASSLCRSDSKALALAILLATIILGAAPLYVAWRSNTNPNYDFSLALVPCPAFGCFLAFDDLYKQGAGASCFVLNTLVTQLYAWTFLLLACWWTPRSWQDASVNQNPGFGRRQWRWLRDGSPARREAARRRLLDINAFLWRAAPNASGSLPLLLVLTGAALLWIGLCRICQVDLSDTDVIIALLFSLNLILKIGLSRAASRPLCEDRRSGALELVLTTPLGAREIVRGQRLALLRQFGPPAMTLFGANFVCLWMGWRNAHDHTFLFWEHLMLNVFLLADLYALSWTGMWFGLRAAKPNRPAVMSIFFILAPPLLAWAVCATIYVLFFESSHPGFGWKLSFTVIGLTGLAIDLLMSVSCRFKLRKNFRRTVAEGKLPARGVP
jgi:hypothetical protein